MHQLRQRRDASQLAVKGIRNQLLYVLTGERRKRDFIDFGASVPDGLKLLHQRMCGIDLVVPVGANQQEVLQLRPG
jgi:hypothetical protein